MYRIIETPNYYSGTCNAPQEGYVKDEDDSSYRREPLEFETEAEAQAWIDEAQSGTYYLSHGEAGSPSYKIVDADRGDGEPDCYDAEMPEYLGADLIAVDDIPTDILDTLQSLDVEYRSSGDDFDYFDAEFEGYYIVFCPRTIAIEDNADDLGGIDWDNEAYYKIRDED